MLVAVVGLRAGRVDELVEDRLDVLTRKGARYDQVAVGLEAVPLRLGQARQRRPSESQPIMS